MKRLGITAGASVIVVLAAACSGSATPTPAASEAVASIPASAPASAPPSTPASASPTSPAGVAPPSSAPPSSAAPASQQPSAAPSVPVLASLPPAAFAPVTVGGRGNKTVAFTIPAGTPALAVIRNAGKRPFSVTTLAAGGATNDKLVAVTGSFQGTFLIDKRPGEHSVAFRVRSDGLWSIEIRPVSMARTWDGKQGLAGQGNDVIQIAPPNTSPLTATLTHPGKGGLVMNIYPGPTLLVTETGAYAKPVTFPVGTTLIEVLTGSNWGLVPG